MISKRFAFESPRDLKEALALIGRHGESAEVLAGGMSLVPMMTLGLVQPDVVVSLNHLPGLDSIRTEEGSLELGTLARHYMIERDPVLQREFPLLSEAAELVGDVQIRHRGTLGGSLAHADPAANYPPVMLVLGAELRLQSARRERVVPASEFFRGLLQTARQPDELLTEVRIPRLAPGAGTAYVEFHRVEGAFAIVNAAAVIEPGRTAGRLALGGVGPGPIQLDLGEHLAGGYTGRARRSLCEAVVAASGEAFGDLNAGVEYRRALAQVIAQRAVETALSRAAQEADR